MTWDRSDLEGHFDIVGDVHGCYATLRNLMDQLGYNPDATHPEGRFLVFVGDLVDRGAQSHLLLSFVRGFIESGHALAVRGNRDMKWADKNPEDRAFLASLPSQLLLDDGRLLVVHGGIRGEHIGRFDDAAEHWTVYGGNHPSGSRPDWQAEYDGEPFVVAGHSVVAAPRWSSAGGGSVIIDTGAGHALRARDRFTGKEFNGYLTAVRWPERTTVDVPVDPSDRA